MSNNHEAPRRAVQIPSPWALIPRLIGWSIVIFIVLFMLMFLLALAGL